MSAQQFDGNTMASHSLPSSASSSAGPSSAHQVPVRLPSVSLPSADLFDGGAFGGGRRQSINSDPFLHAFSAAHDGAAAHARAAELWHADQQRRGPPPELHHGNGSVHPGPGSSSSAPAPAATSSHAPPERWQPPPAPGFQPYPPHLGAPAHPSSGDSHFAGPSAAMVGPSSSYRFGGSSQQPPLPANYSMAGADPLEAGSFFDYSMRRHSLSRGLNDPPSPGRPNSARLSPTSGLKRKPQNDDAAGHGQASPFGSTGESQLGLPPGPKKRPSALAFDGMDDLSLQDTSRREPPFTSATPWEEDERRDSGGSYSSSASQTYSMTAYAPPHTMPASAPPYDRRPPSSQAPGASMPPPPSWDGRPPQPPYAHLEQNDSSLFARRPSIPSVSQMMQGFGPDYNAGPPPASAHGHPGFPPRQPPSQMGRPGQPLVTVSSVPHTPTEPDFARPPRSASNPSFPAPPGDGSQPPPPPPPPSMPAGHPARDWHHPQPPTRQSSSSSVLLDPAHAASLGKDSPYSRSPELRVSHKLAERKRRKEMTQLFEDLRDALPFERGLKASKWEVLSKAIDYVAALKQVTAELAQDNANLRQHYRLPPGPTLDAYLLPVDQSQNDDGRHHDSAAHSNDAQPMPRAVPTEHGGLSAASGQAPSNHSAPSGHARTGSWLDPREHGIDRKPSPHLVMSGGHSPVIPSRLHAQFGPASQSGSPQPSPSLPPHASGSGRGSPVFINASPRTFDRQIPGAVANGAVSAA